MSKKIVRDESRKLQVFSVENLERWQVKSERDACKGSTMIAGKDVEWERC